MRRQEGGTDGKLCGCEVDASKLLQMSKLLTRWMRLGHESELESELWSGQCSSKVDYEGWKGSCT